ncbi:CGNR zinc finger domain-containing protein [Pseudonocardia acaciae]|uniref:CGNR zinc finger domain-containing protein n=1 Tax=Pseudonocardia acaciae TaxID=551276 RepID=UPI00048D1E41|nr:CGNR zinc finger domain-containing protein [Pseudonocardia acaciae]
MADEFRLDCGATWLNLLATKGQAFGARPVERLATVDRLREWLALTELTPAHPPGEADLRAAWRLRETLRPLAMATVTGAPPPAAEAAELSELLAAAPDPVELRAGGERLLRRPPPTTAAALARIARQAVDQLTGPQRHDLAICPEHDCRGVFVNQGGRRRWCPSPACASRGRVRALRARRRAAPPD